MPATTHRSSGWRVSSGANGNRCHPWPHLVHQGRSMGRVAMTLSRNRFLTAVTALTLAAGTALLAASGAHAADVVDCTAFRTELRQLVNPTSEASLLTRWASEAQSARDLYGFTEDLGVVARAAGQPGEGLVPVWRLYRAGDFVWATDGADADDFVAGGYQRQFVEFYVSPTPQSCLTAVDRLERDGVHRVVPRAQTVGMLADGWV